MTDLIHASDLPKENAEDGEAVAPPSAIVPFQRHQCSASLYTDSDCLYTDHKWFDVVCGRVLSMRASCVGNFVAGHSGRQFY